MFTTISWSNYVITVCVLLFFWYLFLILKFYSKELKQLFTGEKKLLFPGRKKTVHSNPAPERTYESSEDFQIAESAATLEDFDELSSRLCLAIKENTSAQLDSVVFLNHLKFILSEYPFVKISSLRQKVNHLIVSECAKYPDLVLTVQQADLLWEETIA